MNEAISDVIDQASHLEQMASDMKVKEIQANANKLEVEPIEQCLYCGEKYEENSNKRWCDSFCRDLYEKQKLFRR